MKSPLRKCSEPQCARDVFPPARLCASCFDKVTKKIGVLQLQIDAKVSEIISLGEYANQLRAKRDAL